MSVVEPAFGNIGTTKRLNRFSLREKRKVQGQRQMYGLAHNIEKLAHYRQLAASPSAGEENSRNGALNALQMKQRRKLRV